MAFHLHTEHFEPRRPGRPNVRVVSRREQVLVALYWLAAAAGACALIFFGWRLVLRLF